MSVAPPASKDPLAGMTLLTADGQQPRAKQAIEITKNALKRIRVVGFFASGIFSGMGPLLTEMFPTELRAAGQGFCYNVGRGVAAFFPTLVGLTAASLGLGTAIGSSRAALMVWCWSAPFCFLRPAVGNSVRLLI